MKQLEFSLSYYVLGFLPCTHAATLTEIMGKA